MIHIIKYSTFKISINLVLDWPWAWLSFSIPKLICLHCGGVHWDCETIPGLFEDCSGTVSQSLHPVHMESAQPKWNGATTAVVLNLNKTKSSHRVFHSMTVSQYDHVVPFTDLGGRGYFSLTQLLWHLAWQKIFIYEKSVHMVNTYSLNHIVNCSLPKYYGTKWHDDIRNSRFGAVSWQFITGSNVEPLLWRCIIRKQAISWTRVWHIKKFHLPDFQDFTFFNTDYIWFRRKLCPNSCHDVIVTCLT